MVLIRLQFFLEKNNLLPEEKFGFRRGHSTIDQVLYFSQTMRDAQNLRPTHRNVAALLDLTKAFDRVWKHKLIINMHDTFNIRGRSPRNSSLSNYFCHTHGRNLLEKVVSAGTHIRLFADDIAVWRSGNIIVEIESRLNSSLDALSIFTEELKRSFNLVKTISTFFKTNKNLYNYQPSLMLKLQDLTYEKHPKYLGFILDPEFTSGKHIEHITLKARKRLNILKYIAGRDWGADATTLRTSFLALIRPILEYGFPIYCCASKSNLEKLEKVQLSAARIINGLKRSCPPVIVLYEADLQPLYVRRQASLVKYFNKLSSINQNDKTARYLNNWTYYKRLEKNSPFSQVKSQHIIVDIVEPHSLHCNLNTL
ncbi:hypothetical protein AVEN_4812-1 [Araneus ventricosus]|uniref:Uncharacterized protein n=1 Tax=Araneus ventricosus TaxID=182803 RepID=A0A4Y2XA36_ARAVE|nr:hypothetical protein AVEN_4812-1 [Araneus ventricosus]